GPVQWRPWPPPPFWARQCLRWTTSARLSAPATARTMTSPPWPPSPPSGPPRGTYFSRRKLQQPRPPSPPLTYKVTRSTNIPFRPPSLNAGAVGFSFNHTEDMGYLLNDPLK